MISAVDTNVLLDILNPDEPYAPSSSRLLDDALRVGSIVISEPVYAELAANFPDADTLDAFLDGTGTRLTRSDRSTLYRAGTAWRAYSRRRPRVLTCTQCGEPQSVQCDVCGAALQARQHVLADFLIGAHATVQADRLITRDRGYYATYFPDLELA
ncbi:MAG: nucleotide-binding protein [Chloroflexi bacterium]|nr:nucleotide-binding protein [Chloroflexota bacterium]